MSFTAALYEGDSAIHKSSHYAELAAAEVKGWTTLFERIWNGLKSFALWIDEKSRQAQYRRVERYLAQSNDLAELERRIRQLERSNQSNWIDCASR